MDDVHLIHGSPVEAALEEMRLYYAVPKHFRARVRQDFQKALEASIGLVPAKTVR